MKKIINLFNKKKQKLKNISMQITDYDSDENLDQYVE